MAGRPPDYTLELGDKICARIMEGESLRSICEDSEMPNRSSVLLWVTKGERGDETYKLFSNQFAHAREAQAYALQDDVVPIADDVAGDVTGKDEDGQPIINHENIQRAKLRIETRFKVAARQHP